MKMNVLISEALKYIEIGLGIKYGADGFFILLVAGVLSLLIIPGVCGKWIGSTERGFFGCFLGFLLPLLALFFGFELWGEYGMQWFGDRPWMDGFNGTAGMISSIVVLLIISPFFFGIGPLKTLVVFFVAAIAIMGSLAIGQKVVIKERLQDPARIWYNPKTWTKDT